MSANAVHTSRPLSRWMKLIYGSGAMAFGVKDAALAYLLLLYYNQVLGLDAKLVGIALLLSFLLDGISDPIVGYISDNIQTRWGRRHPFMYVSAIPAFICFYYLWNPPAGLSQTDLFVYLLTFTILTRLVITFYETPSSALLAEITDSYHQRTNLLTYRLVFAWVGGLLLSLLAYGALLVPTPEYPVGQLNPEGYQTMGLIGSAAILFTILISSLGTHHYIPRLKTPTSITKIGSGRAFREAFESLSNPSFVYLFAYAMFSAVGFGIVTGLNIYINTYFWELSAKQIFLANLALLLSAAIAALITTPMSRVIGKKTAAIGTSFLSFMLIPLPIILRLLDLLPPNGGEPIYEILGIGVTPIMAYVMAFQIVDVVMIIASNILLASMIADIVEDNLVQTGRRSEGLFFASRTFILKCVTGLGGLLSAFVIAAAGFPENAKPGEVEPEVVRNLGILYAPLLVGLFAIAMFFLRGYGIDKVKHEMNLKIIGGMTNRHKGGVIWLTGLSGAGKSTLAAELERNLADSGYSAYVVDGDKIPIAQNPKSEYSSEDYAREAKRVREIAALFAESGLVTIAASISPDRFDRVLARDICPNFHEVYVKANITVCVARDPNKLYKKARAGEIQDCPGISAPYEEPKEADLVVDTNTDDVETCAAKLVQYVKSHFPLIPQAAPA